MLGVWVRVCLELSLVLSGYPHTPIAQSPATLPNSAITVCACLRAASVHWNRPSIMSHAVNPRRKVLRQVWVLRPWNEHSVDYRIQITVSFVYVCGIGNLPIDCMKLQHNTTVNTHCSKTEFYPVIPAATLKHARKNRAHSALGKKKKTKSTTTTTKYRTILVSFVLT